MPPKYKTQYFSAEMCDDLITQFMMKRTTLMPKKWKKEHTDAEFPATQPGARSSLK